MLSSTPVVLISLKSFPVRLTPGLSSHHCHPEFGKTLHYGMANGLVIDFVSETGRWRKCQKGNIWMGTKRKGERHRNCQDAALFVYLLFYLPHKMKKSKYPFLASRLQDFSFLCFMMTSLL